MGSTHFPPESFLGHLDGQVMELLESGGSRRRFMPDDTLCREGERASTVLVVLSGSVKLTKLARSGREVVLELRGPGDVLGEMSVIDGEPRSATAVGLSAVTALTIAADRFSELLRTCAPLAHALLMVTVRRLRQASTRQLELGTVDVLGRVCGRLAELADSHGVPEGSAVRINAGISQQELADWAGVSRDGVVRTLTTLRGLGLVESSRHTITVLDLDALRLRAQYGLLED